LFRTSHLVPQTCDIGQEISTLLGEHACHAKPRTPSQQDHKASSSEDDCIQQAALQPQRHWQFGLRDSLACLWKVHVKDRTTRYFLQVGL
jgi:hypothetical protein